MRNQVAKKCTTGRIYTRRYVYTFSRADEHRIDFDLVNFGKRKMRQERKTRNKLPEGRNSSLDFRTHVQKEEREREKKKRVYTYIHVYYSTFILDFFCAAYCISVHIIKRDTYRVCVFEGSVYQCRWEVLFFPTNARHEHTQVQGDTEIRDDTDRINKRAGGRKHKLFQSSSQIHRSALLQRDTIIGIGPTSSER